MAYWLFIVFSGPPVSGPLQLCPPESNSGYVPHVLVYSAKCYLPSKDVEASVTPHEINIGVISFFW